MSATSRAFWTQQFLKPTGLPYVGVRVFHYVAGNTTTNLDVFQDAESPSSQHANPVVGDASGRVSFYGNGTYRLQIRTSTADGNLILYDWDPVELVHHTATVRAEDKGLSLPAATAAARGRLFGVTDSGGDVQSLWMEKSAAEWQRILTLPSLTSMIQFTKGTDVASSTSTTIPTDGNFFDITGIATIESMTAYQAGTVIWTRFTGAGLTLTHNAASFILLGGSNLVTRQNEIIMWLSLGAGNWKMMDSTVSDRQAPALASATTTSIWSVNGASVHVTGTTTITSLGSAPSVGAMKTIIFDGVLILTNGASLVLPGAANLTTEAGDAMVVYAETVSEIRVISYTRANGKHPVNKGWFWVSTSAPSAVSTLTLSGLTAGKRYRVSFAIRFTANESLRLRFNDDAASVYAWGTEVTNDSADVAGSSSTGTATFIDVTGGQVSAANNFVDGWIVFRAQAADLTQGLVHFSSARVGSSSTSFYASVGHGTYNGSSDITSVNLSVNSGTMTGEVILERLDG
jgi:hypothetical protein